MKLSIEIKTNVVYDYTDSSTAKYVIHQGGTRSGKTYNILLWIIFKYCMTNKGKIITICRKTGPSLRGSVMRDFFDIIKGQDLYSEDYHNKTNKEYYLMGNTIEFISLDEPSKVRGRKRDLLFVNECSELSKEDFFQLNIRTNDRVIIDYNPSMEFHWIYNDLIPREDADFFQTTYLDNPFLDQSLIDEIEKLK